MITDTDYAGDLVLPPNIPTQAECLLHDLEQASRGIVHQVNQTKQDS